MIEQFIDLLYDKGLAVTAEEVADILWLAHHVAVPPPRADESSPLPSPQASQDQERTESLATEPQDAGASALPQPAADRGQRGRRKTNVYLSSPSSEGG